MYNIHKGDMMGLGSFQLVTLHIADTYLNTSTLDAQFFVVTINVQKQLHLSRKGTQNTPIIEY